MDCRTFISPKGEKYSFDLAVFGATAELGQSAKTTPLAIEEGLEITRCGPALPGLAKLNI